MSLFEVSRIEVSLYGADGGDRDAFAGNGDWPKFLSRHGVIPDGAPRPPPLPGLRRNPFSWLTGAGVMQAAAGAVGALTVVGIASTLLVSENHKRFSEAAAPRALALPVESNYAPPPAISPEHVRFAFANALRADHTMPAISVAAPTDLQGLAQLELAELDSAVTGVTRALALSETVLSSTDYDAGDPVAVMILRNLPDTAAFLAGAPSADGSWVIAANEFDHVVVTALSPQDAPVSTDAELISRSGLTLGTVRLPIRPSAQLLASASAEPPEANAAQLGDEPTSTAADPKPDAESAPAHAPASKPHNVRVHVRRTIAVADAGQKSQMKRRRRSDQPASAKTVAAKPTAKDASATSGAPDDDPQIADEKPKGPISKFFAWITGGSKKQQPTAAEDGSDSAFSLQPKE